MPRLRSVLFVLSAVSALTLLMPAAGRADPYSWCAVYGSGRDGGRNCGFVSFEQCMQTIRGMGGFCERNAFYTGPEERPVRRGRRPHDD